MTFTNQTPEEIQASLDPPGAGIPFHSKLLLRYFALPWMIRRKSWEECESLLKVAQAKVAHELSTFPAERLTERVLVPPQPGLEDSSRYWSAAMTARHMTIVNGGIEKVVVALSHGQKIPFEVDIALVKPEKERNLPESVAEYLQLSDGILDRINRNVGNRNSKAMHIHPWFGAMRAKDWFWLLSAHTFLHLRQLRNIRTPKA